MRFDLVDLQLFVAVAETGSITRGAVRSHLALASSSARINGLERALGAALLVRGRRGVVLTAAGESLLDHARIVLGAVKTMRGDLAAYARGLRATIHLLANTAGLSEHLPKPLAAFLNQHPTISIDVEERESAEIAEAVASGAADIGLAIDAALPSSLTRFPFCEDRLVLVVSAQDQLVGRRQVAFRDVLGRDVIGLAGGSALQVHLATQAARLGARLRYRARLKSFDAVCQMVAAGIGIAVMPEVAARRSARSMKIRIVTLRDDWARRDLVICVRSLQQLPLPAQNLVAHLRKGDEL